MKVRYIPAIGIIILTICSVFSDAQAAEAARNLLNLYYKSCIAKGSIAQAKGLGPRNVSVMDLCDCLKAVHEDGIRHRSKDFATTPVKALIVIYNTPFGSVAEKNAIAKFRIYHDAEIGATDGCDQK